MKSPSPRASCAVAYSKANSISSIAVDGVLSPTENSLASSPWTSLTHTQVPTRAGSVCGGPPSSDTPSPSGGALRAEDASQSGAEPSDASSESPSETGSVRGRSLRSGGGSGSGAWCSLGDLALPAVPPPGSRSPGAASSRPSSAAPTTATSADAKGHRPSRDEVVSDTTPVVSLLGAGGTSQVAAGTPARIAAFEATSAAISAAAAAAAKAAAAQATATGAATPRASVVRRRSSADPNLCPSTHAAAREATCAARQGVTGRRLSASVHDGCLPSALHAHPGAAASSFGAAEEAKRSASDTARRIAAAAEVRGGTERHSSGGAAAAGKPADGRPPSLPPSLPLLDTAAARAFSSRSLNGRGAGAAASTDDGPSAAEMAKRRAEEAAREIARCAAEESQAARRRAPDGAWTAGSGGASAKSGGGGAGGSGGGVEAVGEAEAAKQRASAFAKELAERVEREAALQRRPGGGGGGGAPRGTGGASGPASGETAKPVAAAPSAAAASTATAAGAAADTAATEAKRSARSSTQKRDSAWLLTLLRPEHRSARAGRSPFPRNTSRVYPSRSSKGDRASDTTA